MAITTLDQLQAAYATKQSFHFCKPSVTTEGAGTYHSLFKLAGKPAAGSSPGSTAVVPTKDTAGAFNLGMSNPTGGNKSYLARLALAGSVVGSLFFYDRLVHVSGLSGTQTSTDSAVNNTAITRPDANGANVEAWVEWYGAIGATGATLNTKYTDQDGNTNQVGTYTHPANAETVGQTAPLVLAAGDVAVRAVTNYHWSVTTGTAGDFGFTLRRPITGPIPINIANGAMVLNAFDLGLPEIPDGCCLEAILLCSTTSSGIIQGEIDIVQG